MAQYCFAEQKRAVFQECCLRGWWQACVDFPRHDGMLQVLLVPDELRPEVCCIGSSAEGDLLYQALVASAWGCGYKGTETATERDRFLMAFALKGMSRDEGMTLLRRGIASDTSEIDKAWDSLCKAMPVFTE